jgi:hypothetical protein
MSDALFSDDGMRIALDARQDMTAGERLRIRQAARIGAGMHPLALHGSVIRLHPDAPADAHKGDGGTYPRCGTCRHREVVSGEHAGRFPKCLFGFDGRRWSTASRASNGEATDVRAWWPACVDYAPAEAS